VTDIPVPEPGPIRWQAATVTAIVPSTPRIKTFRLALSEPFDFLAGQHVDVRLTAEDGYQAVRSYSIASAPANRAVIDVAIERLADGEVSGFFHDVVAVGDRVELRGPLGGHFVWPAAHPRPLLLIGGGSGAVPLVSMARYRHASGDSRPAALLYSARRWDDVLYRDELIALDARNDGFAFVVTLTREPPRRSGDFGRRVDSRMVAAVLARLGSGAADTFVCGANRFVDAAADGALGAGIPALDIRTERYGE
jgi:ferredoxin-NADP reductase